MTDPDFAAVWPRVDGIDGWLTRAQARVLWDAAGAVPPGRMIVEIGSHQGRSTVVLAIAAARVNARVVAIDPFVSGRRFGGVGTRTRFEANVAAAGVADVVRLIPQRSTAIRPTWTDPIDLLYIDGKHDYWTVRDDLTWTCHLPDGAPVLVHDAFASIGVTLALLVHVLPGRRLRYVGRTGSLASFVVGRPSAADRRRMLRELPLFLRNVVVKVALRFGRLAGHHSTPDPY